MTSKGRASSSDAYIAASGLRCGGTGQVWVGSLGYGSPGSAYAPCFGCPDCELDSVGFSQKANRAGDATNAPAHDTEEVTSMPDNRNSVSTISPRASVTWAIWRPTFRGSSFGYLAIRGVVVLRHVKLAEARKRYSDIRIERMPSLG